MTSQQKTIEARLASLPDYYELLGTESLTEDIEVIKTAYRQMAKKYHPDRYNGPDRHFLRINHAYSILTDAALKERYDTLLRERIQIENTKTMPQVKADRFRFATDLVTLAKKGLLHRKFRKKERTYYLKIKHDLDAFLTEEEFNSAVRLHVPAAVVSVCPDCGGSDASCRSCAGRGQYKSHRSVQIDLDGRQQPGDIITINLHGLRPEPMTYFKKAELKVRLLLMG